MTGLNLLVGLWMIILCGGILLLIQIRRKKLLWDFNLSFLGLVFLLILIARMTVNLYAPSYLGEEDFMEMGWTERFMDSFVHTFQSFSMDEDYTGYISKGKQLFALAYGPWAASVYGIVISVLDILAPVLGGAVLLEILTGVFPRLKLFLRPFRRKFVFSELNDASITLAEDLYRDRNYQKVVFWESSYRKEWHLRPFLVFTDAYPDQESETKSELFDRAKALGAVCIRTDMLHLPVNRSKSVYYFLMDEQEQKNISILGELLDGNKAGYQLWPEGEENGEPRTRVFAFCQSDLSVMMMNNICAASENRQHLIVRPIRDYANTAVSLMYEAPLFMPLLAGGGTPVPEAEKRSPSIEKIGQFFVEKDEEGRIGGLIPVKELHVTILGSGSIAEEVFQAVCWCGQIGGVQLFIHVLSQEADRLQARLQARCPELLRICEVRKRSFVAPAAAVGTASLDDLLRIYPHTSSPLSNAPYAVVDGFSEGERVDAAHLDGYPEEILAKTDYYVAALGDDEKNIFVAMMLKRELGKIALNAGSRKHPVIAPAVFDSRLADSIADRSPACGDPYVIPFGMLEDRFSCRNVFSVDVTADALQSEMIYNRKTHSKRQRDEYSYWANIVRAVHAPYKLFGLGCVTGVDPSAPAASRFTVEPKTIAPDDPAYPAFAWMEHRRWNAYMRTQGFCLATADQHRRYFALSGSHKDLARKLHNCLVETSMRGNRMPSVYSGDLSDYAAYDALDVVSIEAYHMSCSRSGEEETLQGRQEAEYKQWDEYGNDSAAQSLMEKGSGKSC